MEKGLLFFLFEILDMVNSQVPVLSYVLAMVWGRLTFFNLTKLYDSRYHQPSSTTVAALKQYHYLCKTGRSTALCLDLLPLIFIIKVNATN